MITPPDWRAPAPRRTIREAAVQVERLIFQMARDRAANARPTEVASDIHRSWLAEVFGQEALAALQPQRLRLDREPLGVFTWRGLLLEPLNPWDLLRKAVEAGRLHADIGGDWDRSPARPLLDAAADGEAGALVALSGMPLPHSYRQAVCADIDVQSAVFGGVVFLDGEHRRFERRGDQSDWTVHPLVGRVLSSRAQMQMRAAILYPSTVDTLSAHFALERGSTKSDPFEHEKMAMLAARGFLEDFPPVTRKVGEWIGAVLAETVPHVRCPVHTVGDVTPGGSWIEILEFKHRRFFDLLKTGRLTATGCRPMPSTPLVSPPVREAIGAHFWVDDRLQVDLARGQLLGPQGEVWFQGVEVEPALAGSSLEEALPPLASPDGSDRQSRQELKVRLERVQGQHKQALVFLDVYFPNGVPCRDPETNEQLGPNVIIGRYRHIIGDPEKPLKSGQLVNFSPGTLRNALRAHRERFGIGPCK